VSIIDVVGRLVALAETARPRYCLIVLLASLVGLRRREYLALIVSDVLVREGCTLT